ncbi:MAG TPA: HAD-IIB family hydrolase [Nitrospirales bacterium]|nr:HAD-IIB family hydrolase [Nitrospirales bacterium]
MTPIVIFTDLDGTLLDPHTYAWEPAREALELIRTRGIPLILASSKTRAEIEPLRFTLQHRDPFIVENGGAACLPKGYFPFPLDDATVRGPYQVIEIGLPYARLRSMLKECAQTVGADVRGFGDMSIEEVAECTGLTAAEAALAKQREYDEPFVIERGDPAAFQACAAARGLACIHGGRFYHLLGPNDKGRAARALIACYTRLMGTMPATIAIGDSDNDLPLLSVVDHPIRLVPPHIGPAAWNAAIVDQLGSLR